MEGAWHTGISSLRTFCWMDLVRMVSHTNTGPFTSRCHLIARSYQSLGLWTVHGVPSSWKREEVGEKVWHSALHSP